MKSYGLLHTFIVDLAVAVAVGEFNHLFDVAVGQVLAEVEHRYLQLVLVDDAVAVDVEDAESLPHLLEFLAVPRMLAALHPVHVVLRQRHHPQELVEVYRTAACNQ